VTTFTGPPVADAEGVGALTLGGFLDEVAARFGRREAVVLGATRWTYAALHRVTHRLARGLAARGVGPGDRVGVLMGNRPEAVAGIFAAGLAGAVAVPLSTFAPRPELAFMVERAEIVLTLTHETLLARRPAADLDGLCPAVVVDTPGWDALLAAGDAYDGDLPTVDPDDDALVIFSSGTTSEPKAILHGHRAPTLQFWLQAQIFGRHERTRMWTSLPIFWTAGLNTAVGATLAAGGCWVAQETFDAGAALALMAAERVTEPYALPHHIGALEEDPGWATADLSSVTCVYGKSALARHPTITGDTAWRMPVGYGMTETCAFISAHPWDTPREVAKESMGRLLPGVRLRVLDADGYPLGPGETGELAVGGPTLMRRYLGRPASDVIDADGFFRTGDAGSVDAGGFLHWEGRRTEMIKTAGANVSPAELEVALRACAPVKLSRVVGVPDARLDEMVVACITLKEGAEATEDDIRAFLRQRVAAYKVPKRVLFFADGEIPMTRGDTKVRDGDLLALVRTRIGDR
jgi:fatty-acyl-CoA synthase